MRFWKKACRSGLGLAGIVLMCFALGSCSLFESRIQAPVARRVQPPPPPPGPPPCELPYCSVNYDFPLRSVTHPELYICKEERRLWLVQDKVLVRSYRIALGPSPRGDKYYKGDGRTPEGDYFVCARNAASQYYKSLGINYPSPRHAENALASGTIAYSDYCSIVYANECRKLPPANTVLGGAIFIHGGGSQDDWTLGCVALPNSAMDELFEVVSIGTPVHIVP